MYKQIGIVKNHIVFTPKYSKNIICHRSCQMTNIATIHCNVLANTSLPYKAKHARNAFYLCHYQSAERCLHLRFIQYPLIFFHTRQLICHAQSILPSTKIII